MSPRRVIVPPQDLKNPGLRWVEGGGGDGDDVGGEDVNNCIRPVIRGANKEN